MAQTGAAASTSINDCTCSPSTQYIMKNSVCVACPKGTACDGNKPVKPATGFWLPVQNEPGTVEASIVLQGLAYVTYSAGTARENLKTALTRALEDIVFTGTGSVTVSSLTSSNLGSTMASFTITVPLSMSSTQVDAALSSATQRRTSALHTSLTSLMTSMNMAVPTFSTSSYASTSVINPVSASDYPSYSCPYEANCIPANNQSICAEGATGAACATCIPGWVLDGKSCVSCADRSGSTEMLIIFAVIFLLLVACVVFLLGPMLGCDLCGVRTQEQNEKKNEEKNEEKNEKKKADREIVPYVKFTPQSKDTKTRTENDDDYVSQQMAREMAGYGNRTGANEEWDDPIISNASSTVASTAVAIELETIRIIENVELGQSEAEEDDQNEEIDEAEARGQVVREERAGDDMDELDELVVLDDDALEATLQIAFGSEVVAHGDMNADQAARDSFVGLGLGSLLPTEAAQEDAASTGTMLVNTVSSTFDDFQDTFNKMMEEFMGLLKIVLGFAQIFSTFTFSFTVPWPDAFRLQCDLFSTFVNFDIWRQLSFDCVSAEYTFFSTFIFTTAAPLVLGLILIIVTLYRTTGDVDADVKKDIERQSWKIGLFCLFLIYPSISATIFKMWICRPIQVNAVVVLLISILIFILIHKPCPLFLQGEAYLVADYRIVCHTSEWTLYAILAAAAFVIYPVGIPCWMFYLLYSNQETLHDEEHADHAVIHGKLGFLYETYEEEYWYFELVLMLNKLLMTGLVLFIPEALTQV